VLLVKGDAVTLQQRDEIGGRITGQRRAAERRITRQELGRCGVAVGEVAAPTAGDADLFARRFRMIENDDGAAALAGA
jgi:hypothetical protein